MYRIQALLLSIVLFFVGLIYGDKPVEIDYTVKIDGKDVMFAGVEGVIQSIDINERTITVNRKKFNEVAVLD